jgi:hypothetical protein
MNDTISPPSSPTTVGKSRPPRHLLWPILITSLIGTHVISCVTMVIVATHDRSFAVEPDWYQKGLHYEETLDQKRENTRLGWQIKIAKIAPLSGTNLRNVTCTIKDRADKPVEDATVDLVAFPHLRANRRISRVMLMQDKGEYLATLPCEDPGTWEFRFVVTRGKETFTGVLKQDIESLQLD